MLPEPSSQSARVGRYVAFAIAVAAAGASSPKAAMSTEPQRPLARVASEPPVARLGPGGDEGRARFDKGAAPSEEAAKVETVPIREPVREDPNRHVEQEPRRLPRLTSVALFTNIHVMPSRHSYPLGYVHVGGSVLLRRPDPIRNDSCSTAWYAIEPRGYVCNDNTTLLETAERRLSPGAERLLKGLATTAPSNGPLPYGYALSLGTPMYGRIPAPDEQKRAESTFGAPPVALGTWAKGHEGLASADPVPADDELPWVLANGDFSPMTVRGRDWRLLRNVAPRGSLISYVAPFQSP